MAFTLDIRSDVRQLERDLGSMASRVIPQALPRALNRVGASTNSQIVKDISKRTSVKQKDVRARMVQRKASRRRYQYDIDATTARARNLIDWVTPKQAQLGSRGNPQYFRRRSKRNGRRGGAAPYLRKGVTARVWGARKLHRGAFIARVENGRVLVLARKGSSRKAKLKGLVGPSVRIEFSREESSRLMQRVARQRLDVELPRQIEFYLRRELSRR